VQADLHTVNSILLLLLGFFDVFFFYQRVVKTAAPIFAGLVRALARVTNIREQCIMEGNIIIINDRTEVNKFVNKV